MLNEEQTRDKLQFILGTLKDGEKGYADAAEHATDPTLKATLTRLGQERGQLADEVESTLSGMGEQPREGGSAGAALHRAWLNVRDAVSGRDDYAVVAEVERGEDVAKKNYEDTLKEDLPEPARSLIERQYQSVLASHNAMRDLKHGMEAARNDS